MDTNTVTLSLVEYNRLRDFDLNVKKNPVVIHRPRFDSANSLYFDKDIYFSNDEAVKHIAKINEGFEKILHDKDIQLAEKDMQIKTICKSPVYKARTRKELLIQFFKTFRWW